MQKHYFIFSIIIIFFLTNSCSISIHGLMSEHRRAWIEAPALMESTKNPPPLCEASYQQERPLQVIIAKDLKKCLKTQPKAIVYEWATRCKNKACYLPSVLQAWCTEQGVDLYVIAEYYDDKYIKEPHQLDRPILVVNHFYYQTPWIQGYFKKFYQELIGRKRKKEEFGRMLYFQQGEFQGFYRDLEDLKPSTK